MTLAEGTNLHVSYIGIVRGDSGIECLNRATNGNRSWRAVPVHHRSILLTIVCLCVHLLFAIALSVLLRITGSAYPISIFGNFSYHTTVSSNPAPVSSTIKADLHDIAEISLKVALNIITPPPPNHITKH